MINIFTLENCHIFNTKNPRLVIKRPFLFLKLPVCCSNWANSRVSFRSKVIPLTEAQIVRLSLYSLLRRRSLCKSYALSTERRWIQSGTTCAQNLNACDNINKHYFLFILYNKSVFIYKQQQLHWIKFWKKPCIC